MDHRTKPAEDSELRTLIGRVRRRWLRLVALRACGRAGAAASAPMLLAVLVQAFLPLSGTSVALLALAPLASVCAVAVVLWRMQRRPDDRHVARFIEERLSGGGGSAAIDDALVSAVEVMEAGPDDPRAAFKPLIVGDAVHRLREVQPHVVIRQHDIGRAQLEAAAGAALLAVAAWAAAPALSRGFDAMRARLLPSTLSVHVEPGSLRLRAGSPVRILAAVRGSRGAVTEVAPTIEIGDGGQVQAFTMSRSGETYEYALPSVERSFTYEVRAGSARTGLYTITAVTAPKVTRIDLRYEYPSFTGLRSRTEEDGGDIYGPRGTRVTLRVHTDRRGVSGAIARSAAGPLPLRSGPDGTLEADLVLAADDAYRVRLADGEGISSDEGTEYFIRLMDDRPPDVRILRPGSDQPVTPLQEVTIEARADDDYGIAAFELVYSVAGRGERVVPFERVVGTDVQKAGSRLLAVEDLKVSPGDVITYYARARDVPRGKRATVATSDLFFLEVKPFAEEFVSAQSQASGGAGGPLIDSLIAAQKEIISATWNVERRAGAGRSADDVQAIARAQAELRTRVQRAGGGMPPPRPPAPERQAGRRGAGAGSGDGHMAAAAAAMARAQQGLESSRTRDALEHEMAALNALLRAQAEVRQREVTQQQAGAGGGAGRSGEDLSALFDKELQRQQRTNYENRTQADTGNDGRDGEDALERIRELARRQEDLNRRQRELAAAGATGDELKRQLEKLTREQMELRQQAEALSRQVKSGQDAGQAKSVADGGKQATQGGGGGRGSGAPGDMRQASDEMRSAMGELRREDPEAAAARGERAAEQLRRAEAQLRARGEAGRDVRSLQLEARQLAQEQRRIASEAERLARAGGGAAGDARGRLADEQERLTRRAEDLQRAAEAAARDRRDPARSGAAAAAARELASERVGEQSRDASRGLREGRAGVGSTAQQIARALDRVADTLGGQAPGGSRQLSEQLEKTREIRDRLNELEQQVREARARTARGDAGGSSGERKPGARGSQGPQGARGSSGDGREGRELQQIEQEYRRELARAQAALARLGAEPRDGLGMSTPEGQEFSRSAPGTEAFKQDRSSWESLRREIDLSLEQYEAAVSARLARTPGSLALSAGGSQRTPEGYARAIARYFEALARQKQ